MKYNAKRHIRLLERAARAVQNGDWITMGRALAIGNSMLPERIVIAMETTRTKIVARRRVAW